MEEDPSAYDELVALGYRSVPLTVVGATIVRGYDEPALLAALSGRDPFQGG